MGKLSDLTNIFETYKNTINEMGISEPLSTSDIPSSPTTPSPTNTIVIDKELPQENEECVDDSNCEMAKSEVFKILKSANELMNILQDTPNVEPWQLSKIVKASDYICSVKGSLEYDNFEAHCNDLQNGMNELDSGMELVGKIKNMLSGEGLSVNEEVLKQVIFNIECLVESNKE